MPLVFEGWQSLVNAFLVPLYSVSIFVYFATLIVQRMQKRKRKKAVYVAAPPPPELIPEGETGKVNMNGSFKLVKNDNFDGFLAAQGVPWALRRAVDQARPIHTFTHRGNTITVQIQGIIESTTTYEIGGPPKETSIRGRVFRDVITYLDTEDGIRSHKQAVTEDYDIVVTRRLAPDRKSLVMSSRVVFRDDREPVESIQLFNRIE